MDRFEIEREMWMRRKSRCGDRKAINANNKNDRVIMKCERNNINIR